MNQILFYILLFAKVYWVDSVACLYNWQGRCNSIPSSSLNMFDYINSYNTFVTNCNKNPNFDMKTKFFLDTFIDKTINIDCETKTYNFTKQCGLMEIYSVREKCNREEENSTIFMYNMPLSCPFLGLGSESQKEIWIQGSKLLDPLFANILAHEYGHILGLSHAKAIGSLWEYADCSDPMGCASTINICYNAPNANKLGWAKPIYLKTSILTPNTWYNFFIPIFSTSFINHILLNIDNTNLNLFFSIRSSQGANDTDKGILGLKLENFKRKFIPIENAVSIHLMNDTKSSYFIDALEPKPKQLWTFNTHVKNITVNVRYTEFIKNRGGFISLCIDQCI